MYDPKYLSNMTEETPINPNSEKSKIRAEVAGMLLDAIKKKEIKALIARSADFYGPNVENSALTLMVYKKLLKNKNPQWLGKLDVLHSFTYIKDIGKSVALLGNTPEAYNQVWHLPTTEVKLTTREWIELYMKEMNMKKKIQTIPIWAMGTLGIFIPILKELKDVSYQVDSDYFFDSSKFNKKFNILPITSAEGIREIIQAS
jgi:nucleoside-diphosphate-sugar epimerase